MKRVDSGLSIFNPKEVSRVDLKEYGRKMIRTNFNMGSVPSERTIQPPVNSQFSKTSPTTDRRGGDFRANAARMMDKPNPSKA